MRAATGDFELAWAARERGGETAASADVAALLAVADALVALGAEAEPAAVERAWARLAEELDGTLVPLEQRARARELGSRRPGRGALVRAIAVAAALFAGIASVSLRAHPGSFLYPLRTGLEQTALFFDGSLHLRIANARLGDLVVTLEDGPQGAAPSLAESLVAERRAAIADGQDVSSLDRDIGTEVPPALAHASAAIASEVEDVLGTLLPPETPAPSATTSPAPSTGPSEQAPGSVSGETGHPTDGGEGSTGSSSHEGSNDGGTQSSDGSGGTSGGADRTGGDSGDAGSGDVTGGSTSGDAGTGTTGINGSGDGGSNDAGSGTSGDTGTSGSSDGLSGDSGSSSSGSLGSSDGETSNN
jgi:hypothetical protein